MVKKPYIKRLGKISAFQVWIVDGSYIRKNIYREFTNFGQHYRFKFIPKNEFWIDKSYGESEEKYYITHLLVENKLMALGKSYNIALERANKIEKRERRKSKLIKRLESIKWHKKEIILKKIRKVILKSHSSYIKIWIVNGKLVRSLFYIDFTEGGHDKVYPFIPKNEIWLDDAVSQKERKYILLHESHERFLMAKGLSYDRAHKSSSKIEHFCRAHSHCLYAKLKEEIKENNKMIKYEYSLLKKSKLANQF